MRLIDLEPKFVGNYHVNDAHQVCYNILDSVDGAQGVLFTCPKCGGHSILCWFKNPRNAPPVPADAFPKPGRWEFAGDTFDVLSLTPSVDLSVGGVGCLWHGHVTNGQCTG